MKQLSLSELAASQYELTAPFALELSINGRSQQVVCTEVLRWLPGRRLVAKVLVDEDGQPAGEQSLVLKLFVGKAARRYQTREQQGLEWLRNAGQRVPVQQDGLRTLNSAAGLLFDYLADAQPIDAADGSAITRLVQRFAQLHDQGIWHEDAKLDNFLSCAEKIWFVDGDAIRRQGTALEPQAALENLALLLAERPPCFDHELKTLIGEYCEARGWSDDSQRQRVFMRALRQARQRRLKRYLSKSLRNCTEFAAIDSSDFSGIAVRDLQQDIMQRLLSDPDAVVAEGELIKAGNSATVVRWQPPVGSSLIVKRYNLKSSAHAWRRSLRPMPRYRRAWQFGHGLRLFAIATARPLLLLERRGRWPRGEAWLVMEDLGSSVLDSAREYPDGSLDTLIELFDALRQLGIEHGDAKASNFLLHEDRWHVIDLDAVRCSRHGWQKDLARFEHNFSAGLPTSLHTLRDLSER